MAGNQYMLFLCRPMLQALFGPAFPRVILGGAGRVKYAESLKRSPDIPYKKTGEHPESRVEQIALVAMGQIYVVRAACIVSGRVVVGFTIYRG